MDISKREQIILGLMGAAVLAAGLYLLWPSKEPPPQRMTEQTMKDNLKAAEDQLQSLDRIKLSPREVHAVTGSQEPWPADPMAPKPPEREAQVDRQQFQYTGFVRVGERSLAVINGREYQVGEQLETGGFEVAQISPEAVVLRSLQRKDEVRIPYQDPSFFTGR